MDEIKLKSLFKRRTNILASDMDGETVMMNIETGKYYNIGQMGGVIWNIIEQPTTVETIVSQLIEEYDVDQKQCEADILSFLNNIYQQKLIELVK